ncbi:hypothetical protein Gdia_2643 [Gluconacetobacter diazotrophicus PA1 5]|nr:hypothetical protein Gdia_2643 [Gluconacetobacter diazotrophicus PA1 5]
MMAPAGAAFEEAVAVALLTIWSMMRVRNEKGNGEVSVHNMDTIPATLCIAMEETFYAALGPCADRKERTRFGERVCRAGRVRIGMEG